MTKNPPGPPRYFISFNNRGTPDLSTKSFWCYSDALNYASHLSPQAHPKILKLIAEIEIDEETGKVIINEKKSCKKCETNRTRCDY